MKKELIADFSWGLGIVLLALAASYARGQGYIDQETVERIVIGATGLMIAYFGNRIPKTVTPSACAKQMQRVAGWSLFLSGLAYAALWAFAPIAVAVPAGIAVIAAGMLVTIGYGFRLRAKMRAREPGGIA